MGGGGALSFSLHKPCKLFLTLMGLEFFLCFQFLSNLFFSGTDQEKEISNEYDDDA